MISFARPFNRFFISILCILAASLVLVGCGEEEKNTKEAKPKKETATTQTTSDTAEEKMPSTSAENSASTPLDMLLGAMVAERPGLGEIELAMKEKDTDLVEQVLTKITGADTATVIQSPVNKQPDLTCPPEGKSTAFLIHENWYDSPNQAIGVTSSSEFVAFMSQEGKGEHFAQGSCSGKMMLTSSEPVPTETLSQHEVVKSSEMLMDLVEKVAAAQEK